MSLQKFYRYIAQIAFGFYLVWRAAGYYVRRYFTFMILAAVVFLAALFKFTLFPAYSSQELAEKSYKTVFIPRGSSLRQIADSLAEKGLLNHKSTFIFLGTVSGYENQLKAGLYEVPENTHPWHLLKYLTRPNFADIKVTLPEGIPAAEIADILKNKLPIDSSVFMQLVNDSIFVHSLGVNAKTLEGYLLPETYFFTYGVKEDEIIKLLVENTLSIFKADSVQSQLRNLDMSRHEILTLASIVEGEVVVDSERTLISSVYHNRLKREWLLQADPTIQYIIPGPPRRLLLEDLKIKSSYNTYLYKGLPPGPINNPGRKSILAALYPAETGYMYFVATGDGGHYFARTAAEHARNKAKFDRVRREVRRRSDN